MVRTNHIDHKDFFYLWVVFSYHTGRQKDDDFYKNYSLSTEIVGHVNVFAYRHPFGVPGTRTPI